MHRYWLDGYAARIKTRYLLFFCNANVNESEDLREYGEINEMKDFYTDINQFFPNDNVCCNFWLFLLLLTSILAILMKV